jgi:hypothetical protein
MSISLAKTFIFNNVYRGVAATSYQRGISFYSHRLVTDFIEKDNKQSTVQPKNNRLLIRNIGIKIGRDIDIDNNDPNFFKVKTPPPRHLYPEMYHPKTENLDAKQVEKSPAKIDIEAHQDKLSTSLSIRLTNIRSVNISCTLDDIYSEKD